MYGGLVTKQELSSELNEELEKLHTLSEDIKQNINTHLTDRTQHVPYAIATGSANTYVITLNPAPTAYVDGMAIAVKINVQNTGASTINVNGLGAKSILKSNGSALASGNLKANTPYTLRYNGTNFILQGEGGGGNATNNDLRQNKTAVSDNGDLLGTLVTQATTAQTVTPGTTDVVKPAGIYDGAITIKGDANIVPANILKGKSIFGVSGTVDPFDDGKSIFVGGDTTTGHANYTHLDVIGRGYLLLVKRNGGGQAIRIEIDNQPFITSAFPSTGNEMFNLIIPFRNKLKISSGLATGNISIVYVLT